MTAAKRKRQLAFLAGTAAVYAAGTAIALRQGYSLGLNAVVRCRQGHLFAELTGAERSFAAAHHDIRVP